MWTDYAVYGSLAFAGILTICFFYMNRQFSIWGSKNVPFIKPHFFYGNFGESITQRVSLPQLIRNIYDEFKHERFLGVWEMYRPKLFVIDPNLVRDILVKDFETWPNRGVFVNSEVDPLDRNLANLEGKIWKSVRTKLTPTFTSAKLKQMHYLFSECSANLEKYFDGAATNGKPIDLRDISAKFAIDVIGSCVFGIQMNSLNDEEAIFRKMGKRIFQLSYKRYVISLMQNGVPWLYKFLKLSSLPRDVTDFFVNIVTEAFDYRSKNNIRRHDFIDLLRDLKDTVETHDENEVEFDDALLSAQAFVFFAAGFEPSSTTISYCLHELAVNEKVQERLREEIHETKSANKGEIPWDTLKNMTYLDMVIQETLRKHPIVSHVERLSAKPYRIPNTNVDLPAGSGCIIPIYGFHHDPRYFPNPNEFQPERFSEMGKSELVPFTYMPFGGGPRACIAMRFANQQMKMGIVTAIDKFKFSLCEESQNPLQYSTTTRFLSPKDGVWLKITKI